MESRSPFSLDHPQCPTPKALTASLHLLSFAAFSCILFIVDRSCGFRHWDVLRYAVYFLFHIALPGTLFVSFLKGSSISWIAAIALGFPTGYAIEIGVFAGLSAFDAKYLINAIPLLWIALAVISAWRKRSTLVDWRQLNAAPGITFTLCVLMLLSAFSTASHMYSESALVDGVPARGFFHDWVYLISQAGAIKNHWPFEDPGLAGNPLQYHYFMLVHIASVSVATGLETSVVFLRFAPIPLGIVMVVQCFYLGHRLTHSHWGGIITAVFTTVLSEVSFTTDFLNPAFLGYYSRWLYQSPTFFFGLIFYGALILAIYHSFELRHSNIRHFLWLMLLAAAATGAKGTVLPPIIIALGIIIIWSWLVRRQIPFRMIMVACCLGASFILVYFITMSAWGSGEATIAPLYTMRISKFWQENLASWQAFLGRWLPKPASGNFAALACMAIILAGTLGIRIFAAGYFLFQTRRKWTTLGVFLGLLGVITYVMGITIHMNSYSQLYFLLLMRLPFSVLAAACLIFLARRFWSWHINERPSLATPSASSYPRLRLSLFLLTSAVVVVLVGIQGNLWIQRCRPGFTRWLHAPSKTDAAMAQLIEAMRWIRNNTEPNALLIANAYTPENLRSDRWGALDHTKISLHYYYSALAERSLLIDGPTYSVAPHEAWRRMRIAAEIFYEKKYSNIAFPRRGPVYLIVDRQLRDGASIALPGSERLFSNKRIDVYRLKS